MWSLALKSTDLLSLRARHPWQPTLLWYTCKWHELSISLCDAMWKTRPQKSICPHRNGLLHSHTAWLLRRRTLSANLRGHGASTSLWLCNCGSFWDVVIPTDVLLVLRSSSSQYLKRRPATNTAQALSRTSHHWWQRSSSAKILIGSPNWG